MSGQINGKGLKRLKRRAKLKRRQATQMSAQDALDNLVAEMARRAELWTTPAEIAVDPFTGDPLPVEGSK